MHRTAAADPALRAQKHRRTGEQQQQQQQQWRSATAA
jgi:hypothetical protein